jgi:hypothetical protein
MTMSNNVFAKSRVWRWFSGKNRLNFHRPASAATASGFLANGLIERALQDLASSVLAQMRASD